jgi:HK97 family phage portal protein
VILATTRGNKKAETRSSIPSWPSGWSGGSIIDPAAIPPPGYAGRHQRAGVLVSEHTLLQLDVVFTSLRLITNAVLKMGDARAYKEGLSPDNIPYREYAKKQPEVLSDTFGGRLFQYDGRRRTLMSMGLMGEAFWYTLDYDNMVRPSALEVLHPAFMEIKTDKSGEPVYIYGPVNDRKVLEPDKVTHIPFMALPQARRALNPIEYAGVSAALAMAAIEFGSTWFSQGASPSYLLSTDVKLGQTEVERIADRFMVEHSGLPNAHHPLVLDNGMKATKILSAPDEAQYLQSLEYSRNVIASWFGVDELIPNALQRQTPPPAHTAQERMQRFVTLTLSGYTLPLEEAYSSLLPKGVKAGFDEGKLLTPDPQFQAERIEKLRQAQVATPNDLRVRELGWPPSEDPNADQVIQPLASNVSPEQTENPPEPEAKPDDDDEGTAGVSKGKS